MEKSTIYPYNPANGLLLPIDVANQNVLQDADKIPAETSRTLLVRVYKSCFFKNLKKNTHSCNKIL